MFDESHTQHMFTMEPLATRLQVVTNLSEGTVLLDGRPTGALKAGEFQLEPVPVGWHTLQVNSNDVASASLRFEAVAGRAPQDENCGGEGSPGRRGSNLGQEARLVSTGTGSVTLDGRPAGELTRDGLVLGNLGPGTHAVRLQAGREGLDYVIAAGDMPSLSVFMTANRDVGSLVVETRARTTSVCSWMASDGPVLRNKESFALIIFPFASTPFGWRSQGSRVPPRRKSL